MKFTAVQVNYANWAAQEKKDGAVNRAIRVLEDPERARRLELCLCPTCFYIDNMGFAGQAFTEWTCEACEKPQPMWPNTAHPKLCLECADRYGLCVRCLADLELRPRKKVTRSNKFRRRRSSRRR